MQSTLISTCDYCIVCMFQMNKVGLKIRAAIMTEVYRKPLAVTATTLSKFSTGEVSELYSSDCQHVTCLQVINFMSTDTDRIVNFCQSFHQFWSLPFQVVVSLFLLYQQVSAVITFAAILLYSITHNSGWSGIPSGCAVWSAANTSQQMAGSQDREAKHSYDEPEG